MSRTMMIKALSGLSIGTAMALAIPTVASADAYGDPAIAQGDVYTTDGDITPVAYATPANGGDSGDITVMSPHRAGERSAIGAPIETAYSRDYVSYGDLDLTSRYGQDRLMDRVSLAAQDACARVEQQSPLDESLDSGSSCVNDAMAASRGQVAAAIDNATPMTPVAYVFATDDGVAWQGQGLSGDATDD